MPARGCIAGALLALATTAAAQAPPAKLSLDLGVEGRAFMRSAAHPGQKGSGVSLFARPEIDLAVPRGNVRVVGFARWDQHDGRRTHADLREFALRQRIGDFDLVAGVARVFWGVTESVHLVDIINQTDLVENPDGEDKLGQPLVSLAWTTQAGVWTAFVLPYFRERTLPGRAGRLRAPLPYASGDPEYESSRKRKHVDGALRWALTRGPMDLGIAHFSGTAREPRFEAAIADGGQPVLVPVYDLIDQTGADLSWVSGGWLWKLEAVHQRNRVRNFTAMAAGFEYTFYAVGGSSRDVGALLEVLWDSRGRRGPSPYQRDLFLGTRLAANDIAGSELLAGVIVDLERYGWFASIEASRRVGSAATVAVEVRLFDSQDARAPLHAVRRDDHVQIRYTRYF